ncbi:hypothetical protein DPEC_G00219880 [Dallia pectoralis]|uniref:Uncharacterized protein n=1 Tax=Dallia pectoralis TaxID=75939 RepID=A0ACC2G3R0_DALPE|nr:hypothetical protein DPEC_G00219880 [Dallia pectoralis]
MDRDDEQRGTRKPWCGQHTCVIIQTGSKFPASSPAQIPALPGPNQTLRFSPKSPGQPDVRSMSEGLQFGFFKVFPLGPQAPECTDVPAVSEPEQPPSRWRIDQLSLKPVVSPLVCSQTHAVCLLYSHGPGRRFAEVTVTPSLAHLADATGRRASPLSTGLHTGSRDS